MSNLAKLESRLDYTFQNASLLEQSLTHRSYSDRNNERLEFLGDSILNFSVASLLFDQFPEAPEGNLSRLRAKLVKQATLAEIARELDLGSFLNLGGGELKSGGFERDSILSDALEAIVGAIYLDSDINTVIYYVGKLFASRLAALTSQDIQKDAKTRLQEHLQAMGEPVPEYVLIQVQGKSPDEQFEIECRSTVIGATVRATDSSRRRAEQNAARLALKKLGVVD